MEQKNRVSHYLDIIITPQNIMRIDIPSAKMILQNIEAIEDFFNKYENDTVLEHLNKKILIAGDNGGFNE